MKYGLLVAILRAWRGARGEKLSQNGRMPARGGDVRRQSSRFGRLRNIRAVRDEALDDA